MKKQTLILAFALIVSLISCVKIEKLPPEPRVEFRSFDLFDSVDILGNHVKAGRLLLYFEDGDGDLGMSAPEATDSDTTNLFLTLYRCTDEIFEPVSSSDPLYPLSYRIPYMETPGQNKILKGTIEVTLMYFFYNDSDTVYYDFWVKDRAGNLSNTDSTCVVILGENGLCSPQ